MQVVHTDFEYAVICACVHIGKRIRHAPMVIIRCLAGMGLALAFQRCRQKFFCACFTDRARHGNHLATATVAGSVAQFL